MLYAQSWAIERRCAPIVMRIYAAANRANTRQTCRSRAALRWGALLSSVALLTGPLPTGALPRAVAATPERVSSSRASTSRATREEAVHGLPLSKMDEGSRAKASSVLKQVSVFRRLPTQVIDCDPSLYLFLVEHPDLVVNIWEVMEISNVALTRANDNTYRADDGAGTKGRVEFLYNSHDLHVLYAEGSYEGPMFFNPVRGKCLLVLKTGYVRETSGRYYITCRLDAFIQLDNVGVEFVAKTFQPLVGRTADHNFRETTAFLSLLSRTAETNQAGVQQLAGKLTKVDPNDREKLATLAEKVSVKAALEYRDVEGPPPVPAATARRVTPTARPANERN